MKPIKKHLKIESRAWKTLFFVSLINSAQASLSVVGIPSHAQEVSFDQNQLGLLLASLPVFAGISAFCSGSISDFVSRKKLLVAGLAILGAALSLHHFANSFPLLLTLRCITGFASGILIGLPSTLLSDNFHKTRQQSLTGKALCGYAIGQTIGIPVGILLMGWSSFLVLCTGIGILSLLCIPFAITYLPSKPPPMAARGHWLARYFRQAKSTLSNRLFALIATCSFLSFSALSMFYVTFALWLFQTSNLHPREVAPMYFAAGVLQVIVFTYLVQRFAKLNVRSTIAISLLLNALLFSAAKPALLSLTGAAALFALTLGAVSLRIPALQFMVNNIGPSAHKGLRMSIIQTCSHLGKATGSVAASFLFVRVEAHQIILICSAVTLICSILFLIPLPSKVESAQASPLSSPKRESPLGDLSQRSIKKRLWHARC